MYVARSLHDSTVPQFHNFTSTAAEAAAAATVVAAAAAAAAAATVDLGSAGAAG